MFFNYFFLFLQFLLHVNLTCLHHIYQIKTTFNHTNHIVYFCSIIPHQNSNPFSFKYSNT